MIFDEIVSEVCEQLNLTSDEARSRVGRRVNNRYRQVTSSIGLETSRRTQVSKAATIGNRTITFSGIEKVIAIIDKTNTAQDVTLTQVTMDEMHILPIRTDPPRHYAIPNIHKTSVDIYIDSVPATAFTLYADGHTTLSTLAGAQAPDFPESFHDVLIHGAMADEYRKMEKLQLSKDCEAEYDQRLSDLRMWIAKTAYLDIYQGRYNGKSFRWTRDAASLWDQ